MLTSFASAPASPLYFSATDAHDGAFFVVVAVWHFEHLLAVIRSSAGPANAFPAKVRAVAASVVSSSLMSVPRESVGFLTCVSNARRLQEQGSWTGTSVCFRAHRGLIQIKEHANKEDRLELRRSVLLPYSAESMFDLIERAEAYPEFLPWCTRATIFERGD